MAYVQDDRLIKDKGIPYKVVDRKKLDGLCRGGNHQGYVAEVKDFKLSAVDEMVTTSVRSSGRRNAPERMV